jgi:hypothetical protein
MPRRLALVVALAAPVGAEEAPILAEYRSNSGSLPPAYAWETAIRIYADGRVEQTHCRGYQTEGDACTRAIGQTDRARLDAILDAARGSGLAADPAGAPEEIMVGGGLTWGTVVLETGKVTLPAAVARADEARVAAVLRAIEAAVPPDLAPMSAGD